MLIPGITIKKGVCQLLALNKFSVGQWLKTFDTIIFDADGVLWRGQQAIDGAPDTFNALRAMGKQAFICTNTSETSREKLCAKAQDLDFLIAEDEVMSSSEALARYLQQRKFNRKVYIMGGQGIADELECVGIESLPLDEGKMIGSQMVDYVKNITLDPQVGAVAVGLDKDFDMLKLAKVGCYLMDPKVLFLATNRDHSFPVAPGHFIPGSGAMVAAVESLAKRAPFSCGKPNTFICLHLLRQGVIKPERTLMVGDTLYTDIQLGYNCGFQTLLVGTGNNSLQDVAKLQRSKLPLMYQQIPDLYLPKLSDLLKFLPSRNC
ncbi:glycerol-3-phosphate phosphatase [Drosophila grimshawi]|uniref:GH23184 n=1 Tax=Drosophila grimshawi TaxID=7222 RepID=B4K2M7_DROGR|nr:glycerol-3-phosphate phosphatase [Drosophila grimshawi]EDV90881.1 GH23184 [Drosophila grimshawi]